MKPLILALVVMLQSLSSAEARPANEEQLKVIREAPAFEGWSESRWERVLSFEGEYFEDDEAQGSTLVGAAFFRPILVHGRLCLMETVHQNGRRTAGGYEWEESYIDYMYWETDRDCEIENRFAVPSDVVFARDRAPTGDIVRIFDGADRLLQMAIDGKLLKMNRPGVIGPTGSPERNLQDQERARWERYRNVSSFKLRHIDLSSYAIPDFGIVYTASYLTDEIDEHPVIIFSLEHDDFVIHGHGNGRIAR